MWIDRCHNGLMSVWPAMPLEAELACIRERRADRRGPNRKKATAPANTASGLKMTQKMAKAE